MEDDDVELMNNGDNVALLFGITTSEYYECIGSIIARNINQEVTRFLNDEVDEYSTDEFEAINIILKALFNMVDVDFIKALMEDFEISYDLCGLPHEKKYEIIRNSYLQAINENDMGNLGKAKK